MRRRGWGIAAAAAVLMCLNIPGGRTAPPQTSPGITVEDPQGDALWPFAPSFNADSADLTRVHLATVLDDEGEAAALRLTLHTVAPPDDADEHRAFYYASWYLWDGVNPWCSGRLWVWEGGEDSQWGPPEATVHYSCDGDNDMGEVFLEVAHIRLHAGLLWQPKGVVDVARDGAALTVDVPLSVFDQGLSKGRYAEGATLSSVSVGAGATWQFVGMGVDDTDSQGLPLLRENVEYTIGD